MTATSLHRKVVAQLCAVIGLLLFGASFALLMVTLTGGHVPPGLSVALIALITVNMLVGMRVGARTPRATSLHRKNGVAS